MQLVKEDTRAHRNDASTSSNTTSDDKTRSLLRRVAIDVFSAGTAAATVSPIMTIIDRAVIEAAASRSSVLTSMKMSTAVLLRHPVRFCNNLPFRLMFVLYAGTYLTSNGADTLTATMHDLPAESITPSWAKLGTVSTVNVGLSMWKDSQFARTFGVATASRIPTATYSAFLVRDVLTIFASFNLPPLLSSKLPTGLGSWMDPLTAAQLVFPAAMQWMVTPLHLLGLDFHNRRGQLPLKERWTAIRGTWISASVARMFRILPAYGLGGVVNNSTRASLMKLESSRACVKT